MNKALKKTSKEAAKWKTAESAEAADTEKDDEAAEEPQEAIEAKKLAEKYYY